MDQRQTFLIDIIEHPQDDAPRLVFADWLEDHGEAERAEFIRLQCELARLDEDDPRRAPLEDREHELLSHHERDWLTGVPDYLPEGRFERGFLTEVRSSTDTLVESGDGLFARHPITRLILEPSDAYDPGPVEEFRDLEWLGRLEALTFDGWYVGPGALEPVVASRHLRQLRSLSIWWEGGDYAGELLSRCPCLGQLRRLDCVANGLEGLIEVLDRMPLEALALGHSQIDGEGLARLLRSPCARGLVELGLAGNPLGPDDWRAFHQPALELRPRRLDLSETDLAGQGLGQLLEAPCLAELTALALDDTEVALPQLEALAGSAFWPRAEELSLLRVTGAAQALPALCGPRGPRGLRRLDLTRTGVETEGVRHLCAAPFADTLTGLDFCAGSLDDEAVALIATSGRFGRVQRLDLRANGEQAGDVRITDAGFARLAGTTRLGRVRSINLFRTPLSTQAVDALLNGPHWHLSALNIGHCNLHPDVVPVLARSPRLARLEALDLTFNDRLGGAALRPLAKSPFLSPRCRFKVGSMDQTVAHTFQERLGRCFLGR